MKQRRRIAKTDRDWQQNKLQSQEKNKNERRGNEKETTVYGETK